MHLFRLKCGTCETCPEGYEHIGRDDKMNLIIIWWCEVCEKDITCTASIEYLFNLKIVTEQPEPKQIEAPKVDPAVFDKCFCKDLRIKYEEE